MKVITSETMQQLDRRTIEGGVPGLTLMETAGRCCAEAIADRFGSTGRRAVILAGKGNNGGDGSVIARLLGHMGWRVAVHVLARREQISGDAAVNLDLLEPGLAVFHDDEAELHLIRADLAEADVIVDALLGTGLSSSVSGLYRAVIEAINDAGRPVVAVDIPSGIHGTSGHVMGNAVRADLTVTFACAKLGHVLFPGALHTGELIVADIGIPATAVDAAEGCLFLNGAGASRLLKPRDRQAHKGNFGHCLIVAGATGKTGAAALAANSAVRAGSGLVTLAVPASLNPILEVKTTEAMTVPVPDSGFGYLGQTALATIEGLMQGKQSVAVGPGVDRHPSTWLLVRRLVELVPVPLVIDADGLNAVAEDCSVLGRTRSAAIILTPHPGEMARLTGTTVADIETDRIAAASDFARRHGVYVILKGARTVIAAPDGRGAINGTGNPGMASGGMGDVLTGIVASLAGQGYGPWEACCLGVHLHGLAADMVAEVKGEVGIAASDVQEMLPFAHKRLSGYTTQ